MPSFEAWTRNQKELLRLESSLPSPAAAVLLSALVGFGSGHYYAGSPKTGQVHLVAQIVAVVAVGVGAGVATDPDAAGAGAAITSLGLLGFTIDRVIEAANAPFKAHQTSARILSSGSPRPYDASHTW